MLKIFTAKFIERRNVKIINSPAGSQHNPYLLSEEEEKNTLQKHAENRKRLRVPRRPPWTKDMSAVQLDRQEKDAFLEWRRGLAECASVQIVTFATKGSYQLSQSSRAG